MNKSPRILLWDVESSYNLVLSFEVGYDKSIPYQNILTERHLYCISYKWLGEKKIHTISILDDAKRFKKDIHDDYYVVNEFRKVLEQADAQVFHYGTRFDVPMLNARLAFHKLSPVPKIATIDTKNLASRQFRFNSNRLDYLAQFLGYKGKLPNPGDLWTKCWKGDVEAIQHMAKYNRQDVEINEYVYEALVPFMRNNPLNHNQFTKELVCPSCGGTHIQRRGTELTRTTKYNRFQCMDCGAWGKERPAIKDDNKPMAQ